MAELSRPTGRVFLPYATSLGFAVAREPQHRSEVMLPISPVIDSTLRSLLSGAIGQCLLSALGRDAELCGLIGITSEPGAAAQSVHADASYSALAPRMITSFVVLHDILDVARGPTLFYPETHAPCCFPDERWQAPAGANVAEREATCTWFGPLHAGDAVLMDACLWHCGGASTSELRRTLLSFTFAEPIAAEYVSIGGKSNTMRLGDFLTG